MMQDIILKIYLEDGVELSEFYAKIGLKQRCTMVIQQVCIGGKRMTVISLREYASQKNVSYEAVRKQVTRYKDELAGHIIMDGRQQFLDEEAVAFLDARRKKNPVVIYQQNKDEQIEALEEENKKLLLALNEAKDRIIELQGVQMLLDASEKEKKLLEGFIQDAKNEIATLTEEKSQELAEARQRALEAENREKETKEALKASESEIEALKNRKWYQLLFKKEK